ncbi:hypothetical protein N7532_011069 [Penicillium argentinense]|uniref:Uncharacterized protein n=1 Tax=Penicillium argentinense TaxID=1131581 RepID=A0A9W9EHQ9_9EURO|nr:uncharacterized protein N7532_011069 [Penicillium argentinense]KAJ5082026.1 hypothetical protein N7532_011069 [Penicillium argentinense]
MSSRLGLYARPTAGRRLLSSTPFLRNAEKPSGYKETMGKYKTFMGPFGKVFLGAVLTYQIIYWSWLKLEMDESKLEKNEEMTGLEKKARDLVAAQK